MVEQIKSIEITKFLEKNPKTVLLDVRTEDEWNSVGKPISDSLGIKTFFITISRDPGFIKNGDDSTSDSAPCKNLEIKNINVAVSGSGSLAEDGGWIGQIYFGIGINGGNILFGNCSSSGDISLEAGGIIGRDTGQAMDNSTITFDNISCF